jgi:hypothetical protein
MDTQLAALAKLPQQDVAKGYRMLLGFYLKYLDHERLNRGDYLGTLSFSQLV